MIIGRTQTEKRHVIVYEEWWYTTKDYEDCRKPITNA